MANYRYYAPEQADPESPRDARVDIFALGLILNELFTSRIPHGAGTRTIAEVAPTHAFLDPIVEGMIQNDRERRPATIAAVRSQIAAATRVDVAGQRLDVAKRIVVSDSEPDDAIYNDPITIVGVDWNAGMLELQLSQSPNGDWHSAFMQIGYNNMQNEWAPRRAQFRDKTLVLRASERSAQAAIDAYKAHLKLTSDRYREIIKAQHEQRLSQKRANARRQAEEAEARLRVLSGLKLD